MLAIPMWIEAAIAMRDGVADSPEQFELAMRGGLGFESATTWLQFFESIGSQTIHDAITKWSIITPCMKAPAELLRRLDSASPAAAFESFARESE